MNEKRRPAIRSQFACDCAPRRPSAAFQNPRRSDVAFHDVNDGKFGVRLITSYLTEDKHNSYSIYEGPDFASVEKAAKASGAPFESIAEVPETLYPR